MTCSYCAEPIPPGGRYREWLTKYYCSWTCILQAKQHNPQETP